MPQNGICRRCEMKSIVHDKLLQLENRGSIHEFRGTDTLWKGPKTADSELLDTWFEETKNSSMKPNARVANRVSTIQETTGERYIVQRRQRLTVKLGRNADFD